MNQLKIAIINTFSYKLQMLYYDTIDVSDGIYINKTSESKESDTCYYWYFLDK